MPHKTTIVLRALACALVCATPTAHAHADDLRTRLQRVAEHAGELPRGVFTSIAYNLDVADRIDGGHFSPQAKEYRALVAAQLDMAERGVDPYLQARGEILMRGYRSQISERLQGYGVYLPPNYDPKRAYPVLIAMHGGSANGNLFLGVVLGNNMNWKTYRDHLWDRFEARWKPDWIVVTPDGFGQVMWRWMGEQDVLDVLDDVQKHYNVDPNRVVLSGLSNGGVGAYNIGMRHAYRFAAVLAIAGAPSWVQYAGGNPDPLQLSELLPLSGMSLAENAFNTDFRYFHGHTDTGPMKPRFVEAFGEHIRSLDVPFKERWYDAGHDLLYLVHRHGKIYDELDGLVRNPRPQQVRLLTGDYRAARQHWLEVTRLASPPDIARVVGRVQGATLSIDASSQALALMIHVADVPFEGDQVVVSVNGARVYEGPRAALGDRFHVWRKGATFVAGFPEADSALVKRAGVSGPIGDAYYGAMLHVYGSQRPEHTQALERAAKKGAGGWPLWLWGFEQRVIKDVDVTEAMMRDNHLVLYGTPGANTVLERVQSKLPIRVTTEGVVLGDRVHRDAGVGTRFIYPNPLAPERYVLVQAAPTPEAVMAGHQLPDFLPDYVIYDRDSTRVRPRLLFDRRRSPPALGYFDRHWQLPRVDKEAGGDDQPTTSAAQTQNQSELPADAETPPKPTRFKAPWSDQAGRAARQIARRVGTFQNFRARTPFGTWTRDPRAVWSIEPNATCMQKLERAGIRAYAYPHELPTPVPTPVEVSGRVEGVWFRSTHEERTLLLSCEMARRLPVIARIARRHGVRGIDVMSAYRTTPRGSFHTLGLGLDLLRFWTVRGVLSVLDHFDETPEEATCQALPPARWQARGLHEIACALYESRAFSSVLTPNYNEGHRDHFHLDARPQDPRMFLR